MNDEATRLTTSSPTQANGCRNFTNVRCAAAKLYRNSKTALLIGNRPDVSFPNLQGPFWQFWPVYAKGGLHHGAGLSMERTRVRRHRFSARRPCAARLAILADN